MHLLKKMIFCSLFSLPLSLMGGGVILYEVGSTDLGLAGAGWSARAETPSTAFTNPAGMSRIKCKEIEFGAQPIYAHVDFDYNHQTDVIGKNGTANAWLPAGGAFYVEPINHCWAAGASVVGYFGSKLKFNESWVGRYYLTELIMQGFSCIPAVSLKLLPNLSFGFGVNVMYAIFEQKSAIRNSLDNLKDGKLQLWDDDVGFGCVAGILYEITPCTRIGLQYLSKVRLQFKAKPDFHDVGPVLKNALRATGILNSKVLLDVDVPQGVMLSFYHSLFPCLAIMGDLGWQEWSDFQKATITLGSSTAASLTSIPKYQNTWHWAAGLKYTFCNCYALTAGYAYDSSAVTTKNRTLDFPVGVQQRYGIGFLWHYSNAIRLGIQFEWQNQGNLKVDQNAGILAGHVSGKYKNLWIDFINLDLRMNF